MLFSRAFSRPYVRLAYDDSMRRGEGPDFIEALARGLDVIKAFEHLPAEASLADIAAATGLARPTARRMLITLEQLGYVRSHANTFILPPRVLELGLAYIANCDIWDLSREHLRNLAEQTRESCSIAQLDGSDIVYVGRVAVPKLVTLSVTIGTRFPALQTSLGKVLLAGLPDDELDFVLSQPSRSRILPVWQPSVDEARPVLREVRARGWATTDQQLAPGIRSIAAPIRDGHGATIAAVNVNAHAAETSMDELVSRYLSPLLHTASEISADIELGKRVPIADLTPASADSSAT